MTLRVVRDLRVRNVIYLVKGLLYAGLRVGLQFHINKVLCFRMVCRLNLLKRLY